jgi:hypothetical protein
VEDQNRDRAFVDAVLPNGTVVKVAALIIGGAQDVSFRHALSLESVETALSGLAEMAKSAVANVAPDSMELEFSLGLSVEGGKLTSVLVQAGTEASFTVRLGWNRQEQQLPPRDRASIVSQP